MLLYENLLRQAVEGSHTYFHVFIILVDCPRLETIFDPVDDVFIAYALQSVQADLRIVGVEISERHDGAIGDLTKVHRVATVSKSRTVLVRCAERLPLARFDCKENEVMVSDVFQ